MQFYKINFVVCILKKYSIDAKVNFVFMVTIYHRKVQESITGKETGYLRRYVSLAFFQQKRRSGLECSTKINVLVIKLSLIKQK